MALVTLSEVNNALRLDLETDASSSDGGRVDDVEAKIAQAEDIVLDYLKNPEGSEYWETDNAPDRVKAATILVVDCLLDGGEAKMTMLAGLHGAQLDISNPIVALLYRLRDPALA